jgi:hypothetical protein
MVQQLSNNSVVVVEDAAGKASGVYVEFVAAFDSSIGNGTGFTPQVSLAVATRQQATLQDSNPAATVVYMPMKTNHLRPLLDEKHLGDWGPHTYAFCEDAGESCIYDSVSGTAGFAFPIEMDNTETCWPQAAVAEMHSKIWWIIFLVVLLTLLTAIAMYITRRIPVDTPTVILEIWPDSGVPGDEIRITGEYLCCGNPEKNAPSTIQLAGINVKHIVGIPTDTEITVIAGSAAPGTQGIAHLAYPSNPSKKSAEEPDFTESPEDVTFSYWPEFRGCKISSVIPPVGVPGDEIKIKGKGLKGIYNKKHNNVTLAGIPVKRIVGTPTDREVVVVVGEADPGTSGVGDTCKEIGVPRHGSDDADEVPKA